MAISKVILNSDVQMDVTDTTASQSDVASTKYYYGADGVKKQGSYVVPSAVTQATPTISVNSSTGLITASATQSAGVVSAGTKSTTEQLSTQAAQTLYPSTTDQTIASGKYLTGTQTFKGVLLTNLDAGNIKKEVVVKVGDSADDDRITSVTGTLVEGPVYETGTYTPTKNIAQPEISFANTHSHPPILLMMSIIGGSTVSSSDHMTFSWIDIYRAFGAACPSNSSPAAVYSVVHMLRGTTSSPGYQSNFYVQTHNSDDTTDTSYSYAYYYVSNTRFRPYVNSSSYFRSGRTYKWIAVWNPT